MADKIIHTRAIAQMLEDGEPETIESWRYEPDIDELIDDRRAGRIDEETFNRQADEWKQGWIKKLEAWNEGMRFDITFPKDPTAPRVLFTQTPIERRDAFPADLMPQKRGRGGGGPAR